MRQNFAYNNLSLLREKNKKSFMDIIRRFQVRLSFEKDQDQINVYSLAIEEDLFLVFHEGLSIRAIGQPSQLM
jgi:hypothetical protein